MSSENGIPAEATAPQWSMKRLVIRKDWKVAGRYLGTIEFEDGTDQEFTVAISQETSKQILDLIAQQVSHSADAMADQLRKLI